MTAAQVDFAALFREHYPRIYRYVRYRVNDDTAAEDLTAEIFERAYRYRDTYDPARSAFSTWITQIAHNWVNNHLVGQDRRERHEVEPGEDMEAIEATEALPESQVIHREAVQRLLDCLKGLAARDRQIIALRFGSDVRNKDIAEQLGLKEKTVSVILLRALERLRTCQGER
ncbi:MAG: sigma-70 family RNA polymerase sigma factor [Anaerolineae bacterium]|nr:sigma-70 family RNA polymerase sigma factor [Anaerolineae bacterium]